MRDFARKLAGIVVSQAPKERTLEQLKAQRGTRVFIDTNRNGYAQLVAPAYTVRARKGAPVSVPIECAELKKKRLRPNSVTIRTIFDQLKGTADPWKDFGRSRASLLKARRTLARRSLSP